MYMSVHRVDITKERGVGKERETEGGREGERERERELKRESIMR